MASLDGLHLLYMLQSPRPTRAGCRMPLKSTIPFYYVRPPLAGESGIIYHMLSRDTLFPNSSYPPWNNSTIFTGETSRWAKGEKEVCQGEEEKIKKEEKEPFARKLGDGGTE